MLSSIGCATIGDVNQLNWNRWISAWLQCRAHFYTI